MLTSLAPSNALPSQGLARGDRLTEIFLKHRGNISDKWEQYLAIYEMELTPFIAAGQPLRILEIGVQNGGSLQIWQSYLPRGSTIVGIDVDPACADLWLGDGISVLIGDASDPATLDRLLGNASFDVVLDDGSHRSDHIISSFEACFPRVAPGGLYIVEDLHCSYFASHGGGFRKPNAAIEWFKKLADAINADHFEPDAESRATVTELERLHTLSRQLARITFYDSVVVVQRAQTTRDAPYRRIMTGQAAPVSDPSTALQLLPVPQLRGLLLSSAAAQAFDPALRASIVAARETIEMQRLAIEGHLRTIESQNQAAEAQRLAIEAHLRTIASQEQAADIQLRTIEAQSRALEAHIDASATQRGEIAALRGAAEALRTTIADLRRGENVLRAELAAAQRALYDVHQERQVLSSRAAAAEAAAAAIASSSTWRATRPLRNALSVAPPWARLSARRAVKAVWWTVTGQLPHRLRARAAARAGAIHALVAGLPAPVQPPALAYAPPQSPDVDDVYRAWRAAHTLDKGALRLQRRHARALQTQPKFSVIVPVYRTPPDVFAAMINSIREQSYENWELCLAVVDTGDDARMLIRAARAAQETDQRVRPLILTDNLGISGNSNRALETVTGEWVVLLDHDDLLSANALFELARAVNAHPDACLIYSDKDLVDRTGTEHTKPLFKPAWSPDIMLNANYLTHISAMRAHRLREIGGWDPKTDGAQDWDLFLRAIGRAGQVVHVPHVLYHWRQIETSVSVGGFEVKPYAAKGQLKALQKYLPMAGWPHATAQMQYAHPRIAWGESWQPGVSVVVIGGRPDGSLLPAMGRVGAQVLEAGEEEIALAVDAAMGRTHGEVVVLLDARFLPDDESWLEEMFRPLSNPAVALVGGRVLDATGHIVDFGVFFQDGVPYPAFRGESEHYGGPSGGCIWYRNVAAAAGGALAFRKDLWHTIGGFARHGRDVGRPDLFFCLEVARRGLGRLMLNPYARFRSLDGAPSSFEVTANGASIPAAAVAAALPHGDPYLSPHLNAAVTSGAPQIRLPQRVSVPVHDFAAEARHVSATYDATSSDIAASIDACFSAPAGPLRKMLWVIPGFQVPFYGGIHTILRTADYLRRTHGVEAAFATLTTEDPAVISARIARAFPELAAASPVACFYGNEIPHQLGTFDAAVCTLWVTAYPLLRLRSVRRKLYFVQDWEPLFFPAGSISGAVETSYRFGFHGVCNTPSLADSYRAFGGQADFFMPAVDRTVFHAHDRQSRRGDDPFVLICYARPGTPRNCFEAMSEGLRLLKRRYGDRIEIVSAGAEWDPAQFDLNGIVRNLGLLPYAETGALYRAADAGLVAMATRHPSYLPFELMACGAAVVTNRNPHTEWFLRDGENSLLCEMTRSDIAQTVGRLVEDESLRDAIAARALDEIEAAHLDWDATLERIHAILVKVCETSRGRPDFR